MTKETKSLVSCYRERVSKKGEESKVYTLGKWKMRHYHRHTVLYLGRSRYVFLTSVQSVIYARFPESSPPDASVVRPMYASRSPKLLNLC